MKQISKITSIFVALTFVLVSCSPANVSPLLNKENPKNLDEPTTVPTQPVQNNQSSAPASADNQNKSVNSPEAVAALEGVYENIYQQVNPSVVNIQVQQTVTASSGLPNFDLFGQQFSQPQTQIQRGLGSGFVWDTQGHIVTNNHVVNGADKVTVTFSDGTTVSAKVIGKDVNSDLAVVQVDAPAELLKPVTMSDSSQVKVGQMAVAIGNPYGLEGSMTVGIISAMGRSLPVNLDSAQGSSYTIPDIIQTDAPINPGNSGGVLVDDQGAVIGVTSAIESQSGSNAGIGFAVPSQMVEKVIPVLIKSGKYEYPWLGISGMTMSNELAKAMSLDENQRGVLVGDVTANGPADKAGMQGSSKKATIDGQDVSVGGDIIIKMGDRTINRFEDIASYLASETSVGQSIDVVVLRDNKEQKLTVTLQARPTEKTPETAAAVPDVQQGQPSPRNQAPDDRSQIGTVWLGITGTDITPEVAQSLNIDSSIKGVLVMSVVKDSPADQAGLQGTGSNRTGDIITALDGSAITSMTDLRAKISEKQAGDVVALKVLRDGTEMSVEVTLATR